jgi:hypothetical protein
MVDAHCHRWIDRGLLVRLYFAAPLKPYLLAVARNVSTYSASMLHVVMTGFGARMLTKRKRYEAMTTVDFSTTGEEKYMHPRNAGG